MSKTRKWESGEVKEYEDTHQDFHVFVWNVIRHANELKAYFWPADEIVSIFVKLFPNMIKDMFRVMHRHGLHSYFGPARKSPLPAIPEFANSIITKDDDISIPCVLRTCNYIYYASGCRGTVSVKIVAGELLRCIKDLKNGGERTYSPRTAVRNVALEKSIWIVSVALASAKELINGSVETIIEGVETAMACYSMKFGECPLVADLSRNLKNIIWPDSDWDHTSCCIKAAGYKSSLRLLKWQMNYLNWSRIQQYEKYKCRNV